MSSSFHSTSEPTRTAGRVYAALGPKCQTLIWAWRYDSSRPELTAAASSRAHFDLTSILSIPTRWSFPCRSAHVDDPSRAIAPSSTFQFRSSCCNLVAVTPTGQYEYDRGYTSASYPVSVSPSVAGQAAGDQVTSYTDQSVAHETQDEQPYDYYQESQNVGIRYSTLLSSVDSVDNASQHADQAEQEQGNISESENPVFGSIQFEQHPESLAAILPSYFAAGRSMLTSHGYFVDPSAHQSSQHAQAVLGSHSLEQYQSQPATNAQASYYPIDTATNSVLTVYTDINQIQATLVSLLQYITAGPPSTPAIATDIMPRLADISRYLGDHAIDLGLADDNSLPYDCRLQFWRLFNRSWIGVISRNWLMSGGGTAVAQGPTSLTRQQLEDMAELVISLSDNIQRYGLVDYEMGVWEERILDGIQCMLDQMGDSGVR
ncbi:uncharacterized protein V1513DRAFT_429951 [Lipomyces chichibuensis]|uniref:uncharacterized protein n=1 Tax=Lipomyces chichibuensis TaxID=1546026 RepID=UPI0033438F6D